MEYGVSNDSGSDHTEFTSSSAIATLVLINSSNFAPALYGVATGGPGVLGSSQNGYGGLFGGGRAAVRLGPASGSGAPSLPGHQLGELYVDSNGVLYCCTNVSGSPAWINLSSGSKLLLLSSPARVYDSRPGQPNNPANGNMQGALAFSGPPPSAMARTVNCANDYSSGNPIDPGIGNAKALLINLAVIPVAGTGALAAYASGSSQPATSTINWSRGVAVLANAATSACNASQHIDVAVVAAEEASTNFVVDVIGYYQ
jgi:hypothetical protein